MAAIKKATLKIRTAFADETYRDLEFGPFDVTKMTADEAKSRIAAFKTKLGDIAELYLSDGGASCVGITSATLIESTDEEINLNDD